MEVESKPVNHSPWTYVLGLYFPFGIMLAVVVGFPGTLLKLLGFSNQVVGIVSGLGLVAIVRFLYTPWLDGSASKRVLSLFTIAITAALLLLLGGGVFMQLENHVLLWLLIPALLILVVVSSAHETAADGYYIRALDAKRQAQFIGVKTAVMRIGGLSAGMGLALIATRIAQRYGAVDVESPDKAGFYIGFAIAYFIAAAIVAVFFFWNKIFMPVLSNDQPVRHTRFAIGEVFREYFQQRSAGLIVAMLLLFRLGDGFLAAMKGPFYLDPASAGGLGIQATAIPYYGLLTDAPWMILGGLLGGYLIKWFGIRRTFLPLALCISLPNISYILLAIFQPDYSIRLLGETLNVWLLGASSLESLGYGFAFSAMFYYMHITATESGRNKTSILAISFALMNAGWNLPGMLSGFVQAAVGYVGLFAISCVAGWIILFIIPHLPAPLSEQIAGRGSRQKLNESG